MTDWPAGLRVAPIREWPGALTPDNKRRTSLFSATWSDTTTQLGHELRMLIAKDAELLVAIPPEQFRLDGFPRAQAKAEHPGVILSFDSRVGHLSYPCDTFVRWQDNLRAIVLALEALRKIDRYGVTSHGEQYRGFAAITAGTAAEPFHDAQGALVWLSDLVGVTLTQAYRDYDGDVAASRRGLIRMAKRITHPDHGGSADEFANVTRAEQLLRDAMLI